MNERFEEYIKPAVLRLDYEVDVKVSLAQNCKTSQTTGSGTSPCTGGAPPCRQQGS